ncbi:MAG: hypothetical protein A2Y10_11355 [Planctomycetes bacterium GWF2_41_51]|nr:MAG: hypothetical protein A2Y10_11355 [Planctomycetes bacterium GWF2_41_51]HBG28527.1 hypothetical protein [Phycisphaerales bacterium]
MKTRIVYILILIAIAFISSAFAQQVIDIDAPERAAILGDNFSFFSAVVCGVVLALALNLIFTNLAVATGISIIKPEDKLRHGMPEEKTKKSETSTASTIKTINNVFGLWTLVITSICLFFACWFAIEISGANTLFSGAIVALVIWGAFYLIMTVLEATVLTTALGSLYRTATSAMQGIGQGIKGVFEKSPAQEAADTAAKITEAVRDEIFSDLNTGKLKKELQSYIQQLRPPSARDIKKEIADLLRETQIHEYPDVDKIVTKFEQESPNKQRAQTVGHQVRDAFNTFKQQRQSGKDTVSAGVEAAMSMTGKSPEDAQRQRQQLEEYLRKTNKKELQPEELKKRIETIFTKPKEGLAQIKESIGSIDKNTAVTILEQRQDISHEEALKIADNIQKTLDGMKSLLGTGTQKGTQQFSSAKEKIEDRLRHYIESLDEPQLDYDAIKDDVKLLFHDPKAGADSLINRLKSLDRDTLKTIIASRSDISDEQAEKIVSKIEETRDDIVAKAQDMKFKTEQKLRQVQETAANVAEETRENAAIASWWAFGTAAVSGAASVLGAYTAFAT